MTLLSILKTVHLLMLHVAQLKSLHSLGYTMRSVFTDKMMVVIKPNEYLKVWRDYPSVLAM